MSDQAGVQSTVRNAVEGGNIPENGDDQDYMTLVDRILEFDLLPYLSDPWYSIWESLQESPILFAIIIIGIGYAIGSGLKYGIRHTLKFAARNHLPDVDYQVANYLTQPVKQTCVAFTAVLALATLDFPGTIEHILIMICFTALLFFWGRAWFRATRAILKALEAEQVRFEAFHARTIPLFEMSIKLVLLGLFVYLFFVIWGLDPTAWLASAGIIGIAVGFAARDTLANLISGVSIVADAPYKIGDYIVLETGERGLVTRLGIRSTRILTRDDIEISVPNAMIGNAKIINESGGPTVRHRIRLPVGVAYDSNIDKVINVLMSIARSEERVTEQPEPRVRIRGFGDNSINVELLCWIARPAERGAVSHRMNREILLQFRANNIEIPFPQHDIYMREPAAKDVSEEPDEEASSSGAIDEQTAGKSNDGADTGQEDTDKHDPPAKPVRRAVSP